MAARPEHRQLPTLSSVPASPECNSARHSTVIFSIGHVSTKKLCTGAARLGGRYKDAAAGAKSLNSSDCRWQMHARMCLDVLFCTDMADMQSSMHLILMCRIIGPHTTNVNRLQILSQNINPVPRFQHQQQPLAVAHQVLVLRAKRYLAACSGQHLQYLESA